ncbi:MAG: transcriptional repressor [SAR324 cluster bacterium]|nr:transcriptional repressor [SAR324 cluster bacterium]
MHQASGHNHRRCIAAALHSADRLCAGSGTRMTALRRKVLAYVWRGHDAVKAYDILARLGGDAHLAKPPTVYRTLQFLRAQGLVHRLESLNAFVGCPQPGKPHEGQFLICSRCGLVREIHEPAIADAVAEGATAAGFRVERQMVEVQGLCAKCR